MKQNLFFEIKATARLQLELETKKCEISNFTIFGLELKLEPHPFGVGQ